MNAGPPILRQRTTARPARQALWSLLGATLSSAGLFGSAVAQSAAPAAATDPQTAAVPAPAQPPAARAARAVPLEQLGGQIWFAEDPTLLEPSMSVSAPDKATWAAGRLGETLKFTIYTNYAAFLKRGELRIYGPNGSDRVRPIAVLPVPLQSGANQFDIDWDGTLSDVRNSLRLNIDDRLQYVLRVYDAQGRWDETRPGVIRIVSDLDKTRALEALRQTLSLGTQQQSQLSGLSLQDFALAQTNFGNNNLVLCPVNFWH